VLAVVSQAFGSALPLPIRKLLRCLQIQERKVSGLVAGLTFVPMVESAAAALSPSAGIESSSHFQHAILGGSVWSLHASACVLAMALSWTVSQAIASLVMLSPFALLDLALIGVRGALLSLVASAAILSDCFPKPWGSIASLVLLGGMLAIFFIIAGWCVRLNICVGTFAFDMLFLRWRHADVTKSPYLAFLGSGSGLSPGRVRCFLSLSGDRMLIRWRRLFVGPVREFEIEARFAELVRGVLWHAIEVRSPGGRQFAVDLPPRYRACEAEIVSQLGIGMRDGKFLRGWAGVKSFFGSLLPRRKALFRSVARVQSGAFG